MLHQVTTSDKLGTILFLLWRKKEEKKINNKTMHTSEEKKGRQTFYKNYQSLCLEKMKIFKDYEYGRMCSRHQFK